MFWPQIVKENAIAPERILIQIGHLQLIKHGRVGSLGAAVANHRGHIFSRTSVIALSITPERPLVDIFADIDRLVRAIRPRHLDDNNLLPADSLDSHIVLVNDHGAYLVSMDGIPEISEYLACVIYAYNRELVVLLLDTEQDRAAIGVRERTVRLPEVGWDGVLRQLALKMDGLSIGNNFFQFATCHVHILSNYPMPPQMNHTMS